MEIFLNNKFFYIFLGPFLLGALIVLSISPINFTIINFFSFSILLYLMLKIKEKKISKVNFFYLGCAFGFGFFLFGNYWISISLTHDEMFKGLIPFSLILIPLFLALFFGLATFITGPFVRINFIFILFFSLIFSIFEFLRGNLFTGFPWNLISYSWFWSVETIQILSLIGSYSLSLISVTFFCIPFLFFDKRFYKEKIFIFLFFIFLFIVNYFYGQYKINSNNYNFDKSVSIKIISPNFSLKDYNTNTELSQLQKLIEISNPNKNKKTIFIWPEGIFYESHLQDIKRYKSLFSNKFSENHLIILGINNFTYSDGEKYFNSLVVLNNHLEIMSIYNKINLVPFGEFLPFEKLLSKFGIKKITRGYNSFSKGDNRSIINLGTAFKEKLMLPLICYEIIYPGNIKKNNEYPDLVVNISEDGWFGNSIGPFQHFSKAIFRSIEEGIFIARAANKGISGFINPNGIVIKSLNTGTQGVIELDFPSFFKTTLFSKYGNKIFFLIIFLYITLILILRKKSK